MTDNITKPVATVPDKFGSDPPSKTSTYAQALLIILYYVGLDVGLAMLIMIKHVKEGGNIGILGKIVREEKVLSSQITQFRDLLLQ